MDSHILLKIMNSRLNDGCYVSVIPTGDGRLRVVLSSPHDMNEIVDHATIDPSQLYQWIAKHEDW